MSIRAGGPIGPRRFCLKISAPRLAEMGDYIDRMKTLPGSRPRHRGRVFLCCDYVFVSQKFASWNIFEKAVTGATGGICRELCPQRVGVVLLNLVAILLCKICRRPSSAASSERENEGCGYNFLRGGAVVRPWIATSLNRLELRLCGAAGVIKSYQ